VIKNRTIPHQEHDNVKVTIPRCTVKSFIVIRLDFSSILHKAFHGLKIARIVSAY
jgi:hypothetical protein